MAPDKPCTVVIEESDRVNDPIKLEELVYNCYDRKTAEMHIKKQDVVGFADETFSVYQTFIEHRRSGFDDAANARRSIIVETHQVLNKTFPRAQDLQSNFTDKIKDISDIVLPDLVNRPTSIQGGIWDNWSMIIRVAEALDDPEFVHWSYIRMLQDSLRLVDSRTYEPQVAIFCGMFSSIIKDINDRPSITPSGYYRSVKISEISNAIKRDFTLEKSNMAIAAELRLLGFKVGISNGVTVVHPDPDTCEKVISRLGLSFSDFLLK